MTSDDCSAEPPDAVARTAQGSNEPSSQTHTGNKNDVNQPQPSSPPETPSPSPRGPVNDAPAPEAMSLQERYQATLRHVHTLQGHNARLYEDNCKLVNTVNTLNDRLAFVAAPQNTQACRLADTQEKLRTSEASRALINRKYQELLQCASAGSAQRHLHEELQAMQEAYASLDREYRLLAGKYARLKAVTGPGRVVQQPPQSTARALVPVVRSEVANTMQPLAHDRSRNSYPSPTSAMLPGFFQPVVDQRGNHRRFSSESVMVQSPLRPGPTPMATTWLAPLPTPPLNVSLVGSQISPKGIPVHAPVPAGSLPLPYHPQINHDPRTSSGLPAVAQSRHLVPQGAPERPIAAMIRQRCSGIADETNNGPAPGGKQTSAPVPLTSSPRAPKRTNSELEFQTSGSPGGAHKKPRIEGEIDRPTVNSADTCPVDKIPSPPASTDSHVDRKLSVQALDVCSYEDCVNLIFEKDANVENGVFCGLCLDRYEAKMIPEPPDVLVQPDFDHLVKHCMTTHPAVWDDLRHKA